MTRPSWVQRLIGVLPGTVAHAGPWVDYPVTASNAWGNGYDLVVGGSYRWQTQHSMRVYDTDSTIVKISRQITGTIVDSEYSCGFVAVGAVGARYWTTLTSRLTAPVGASGVRTTTHSLPSGTKRVFIGGCAFSGISGQHIQTVSFPTGSTVTEVPEPATGTVTVDGAGSHRLSTDGFVSSGGVLSMSGGNDVLRAAWADRLIRANPGQVLLQVGTNTKTDGVPDADYQVGIDECVRLALASLPSLLPADVFVLSLLRRTEDATTAAYRTAAQTVCTARGATYVDGLPIFDASDLSADTLHPKRTAQTKLANKILEVTNPAKRLWMWVDSIPSGSSSPQSTGYTGSIHLIRAARV